MQINEKTDALLSQIADSADETDPDFLRKIIPNKESFLKFLRDRGRIDDPDARAIIAGLESYKAKEAVRHPESLSSGAGRNMQEILAEQIGLPQDTVREMLREYTKLLVKETRRHGSSVFPGLGSLIVTTGQTRVGRNPASGATVRIRPKKVVKLRLDPAALEAMVVGPSERRLPPKKPSFQRS